MMTRDTANSSMLPEVTGSHGQQALHHVQVGDGPADQLPGADLVLARAVQPGQRAEQLGPQVVLDVEGQPAAVVAAQVDAPKFTAAAITSSARPAARWTACGSR